MRGQTVTFCVGNIQYQVAVPTLPPKVQAVAGHTWKIHDFGVEFLVQGGNASRIWPRPHHVTSHEYRYVFSVFSAHLCCACCCTRACSTCSQYHATSVNKNDMTDKFAIGDNSHNFCHIQPNIYYNFGTIAMLVCFPHYNELVWFARIIAFFFSQNMSTHGAKDAKSLHICIDNNIKQDEAMQYIFIVCWCKLHIWAFLVASKKYKQNVKFILIIIVM